MDDVGSPHLGEIGDDAVLVGAARNLLETEILARLDQPGGLGRSRGVHAMR
jgi:hypothetical protein